MKSGMIFPNEFTYYLKCPTQLNSSSIQISDSIHKAELNLNHCLPSPYPFINSFFFHSTTHIFHCHSN